MQGHDVHVYSSQHTTRCLIWVRASVVRQQMVYSSSVDIRPEWAVVEQIPFTALAKLHYRSAPPSAKLASAGFEVVSSRTHAGWSQGGC